MTLLTRPFFSFCVGTSKEETSPLVSLEVRPPVDHVGLSKRAALRAVCSKIRLYGP